MRPAYKILLSLFMLLIYLISRAQTEDVLKIEKDKMLLKIDRNLDKKELQNLCNSYAIPSFSIDSLFELNYLGKLSLDGWQIKKLNDKTIFLVRSLTKMETTSDWSKSAVLIALKNNTDSFKIGMPGYPNEVTYGRNRFGNKVTVRQRIAGQALFWLPENLSANKVYLSGNFNDWSPYATPMTKTDSGWVTQVKIVPGKYFYKFIVDGKWTEDKFNKISEPDGHGGKNSTYFQTNHTFFLDSYKSAKKVFLSGSFNNWNPGELPMFPTEKGWMVNLYLQDGLHTYKFIVDGNWITDPANKRVRPDGEGNFNSVIGTGDTITFILKNHLEANQVILSGSFNNWRTAELVMEKFANGWKYQYMLPPGNYEYKFIVDGKWITDPNNPHKVSNGDIENSVLSIKPNHTFVLQKNASAKTVCVSGSFNSWADPGYQMHFDKEKNQWNIPLYLKPGKQLYKFVVDGKWIIDPGNPNWEENEYNTGNSVLWLENSAPNKQ